MHVDKAGASRPGGKSASRVGGDMQIHLGSSWLGLRLLVTHDATPREKPCCTRWFCSAARLSTGSGYSCKAASV